jgi:hypothetical protein
MSDTQRLSVTFKPDGVGTVKATIGTARPLILRESSGNW